MNGALLEELLYRTRLLRRALDGVPPAHDLAAVGCRVMQAIDMEATGCPCCSLVMSPMIFDARGGCM
ncbi:Hypothetical protein UVM_LOCUS152 [uncultured virus]|nr:Hypothetical protein UVM_LOCUS152 [uncultured virus]